MDLNEIREKIDEIDKNLVKNFCERMKIVAEVAAYKKAKNLPVRDETREQRKLEAVAELAGEGMGEYTAALYEKIFELSRSYEHRLMEKIPRYGLLGRKLGHSYSPQIHALMGECEYPLYEKEPSELEDFLKSNEWDALNVTIPYKKDVVPYLDDLSPDAEALGSVNTIVRLPDGSLYGDNTDVYGFRMTVELSGVDVRGSKALVFGSGGASVTVCHVLKELGAEVTVISRTGEDNYVNLEMHADADILVNATPLGMYPDNGTAPVDITRFPNCRAVFDLVYNPRKTAFLMQAEKLKIPHFGGLLMLAAQAKRCREVFESRELDDGTIHRIVDIISKQMQNIVLIGMPGCGKTSVGKVLASITGRELIDADEEIEKAAGCTIPEIFAKQGEEGFRKIETEVLRKIGKKSGKIIATGGGCVTREENYELLHQNGVIIWVKRDIGKLPTYGRPLSEAANLREMYRRRAPLYERFADGQVENSLLENTAYNILKFLKYSNF